MHARVVYTWGEKRCPVQRGVLIYSSLYHNNIHIFRSILSAGVGDVGLVCMLVHNCTCVEDAKDRR